LFTVALAGCATTAPAPRTAASQAEASQRLTDLNARNVLTEWQRRLEAHVARGGSADPTALAQMPSLRSQSVLRPGQIVFAATDIESFAAERDGYDAFGLLVGRQESTAGPRYVFIVGTVARSEYRSVAVADIRAVAMTVHNGDVGWDVGPADAHALALYRQHADGAAAVRFPAGHDRFRLVDCAPAVCVEELRSGARWVLPTAVSDATGARTTARAPIPAAGTR